MTPELFEISWDPNPLKTRIILTDMGRLRVKLGIASDLIEQAKALFKLAQQDQDLKWTERFDCMEDVEKYLEERAKDCEEWLLEEHCGDCTCVPCSCTKCYAEEMLGFYTTEGLGTHEAAAISAAFDGRTSDEALDHLINDPITASWGGPDDWAPYVERWRGERDRAVAWLRAYKARTGT